MLRLNLRWAASLAFCSVVGPAAWGVAEEFRLSISDDAPAVISAEPASLSSVGAPEEDEDWVDDACYDDCDPQRWARAEYLWWWTKGNDVPPLVTTSPATTPRVNAGVLPGAQVLFGNDSISGEDRSGFRLTYGQWLDDCHKTGVEFNYFSVFDDGSGDYDNGTAGGLGGNGLPILGRPFFNAQIGAQDALLVSFPGLVNGAVNIDTNSELHSASALLRQQYREGCRGRVDLLGGYRYFRFSESTTITNGLLATGAGRIGDPPPGTTIFIEDRFAAGNTFHGGELGFAAVLYRDRFDLELLAKVALGNLHRVVDISGSRTTTIPGAAPATANGGLLALPTNIGVRSNNDFAALPEFGVNINYCLTDRVSLVGGYTLLMLTDVSRTGEQIDLSVNPTQINNGVLAGAARPQSQFTNETDFWAQGMNFGIVIER